MPIKTRTRHRVLLRRVTGQLAASIVPAVSFAVQLGEYKIPASI